MNFGGTEGVQSGYGYEGTCRHEAQGEPPRGTIPDAPHGGGPRDHGTWCRTGRGVREHDDASGGTQGGAGTHREVRGLTTPQIVRTMHA